MSKSGSESTFLRCPSCGHGVYRKARRCPRCNHRMHWNLKYLAVWAMAAAVALALGGLLANLTSLDEPSSTGIVSKP